MPKQDVNDFWTDVSQEDDYEEDRRRAPGGPLVTLLLLVLLVPPLGVGLIRFGGEDGNLYSVGALALLPFGVPVAVVVLLLALRLRRWLTALTAVLVTIGLVGVVLPRALAEARPYAVGTTVRVLTLNLDQGRADPGTVLDLVRRNHVDLISLQELTPGAVAGLDAAGLRDLLPNVQFDARPGPDGTGLASRYPLQALQLVPTTTRYALPGAVVDLPGQQKLQALAVHVTDPVGGGVDRWQRELASLPEADVNQPARMLIGDFNATVDHAALRRLLANGYVDAAAQTGQGLHFTWPANRRVLPPLITIDHVLVDHRCSVDTVGVYAVPGTQHRAVEAQFVVPDPSAH